jgi:transcriptional regulator of met regulon
VKETQETLNTQLLVRERCKEDAEMALTLMRELGLQPGAA